MKAAVQQFMTGLIDYAGFFPPAGHDIQTALGKYATHLEGNDSWMLGRCILPATQLHRVILHPGFRCSVIVSPEVSEKEFDQLKSFKGQVEMVETRLPEISVSSAQYTEYLLRLNSRLLEAGIHDVKLFAEADNISPAAASMAAFNHSNHGKDEKAFTNVGYKLRCGGLDKQAFPTPEIVAAVISTCHDHRIPIKFTAGLHHPLPHRCPEMGAMQHGFLNIVGAALLCWSCNLSSSKIATCLGDESSHLFHFTNQHFSWRSKTISASEIKRLRQNTVLSFGSCSFTEPVEGLRSLGFLGKTGA